jgi:hypothetical protein
VGSTISHKAEVLPEAKAEGPKKEKKKRTSVQFMRVASNPKRRGKLYKIKRITFIHATVYRKGMLSLATVTHSTRK